MALSSIGVDIYGDRDYSEQDLMFHEISLMKKFVEDVGFLEFDQIEASVFDGEGDETWLSLWTNTGDCFRYL